MRTELRTWSINGDFVTLAQTGVARYAREVTLALDALLAENHPLAADLALTLLAPRQPRDLPLRCIPTRVIPELTRPRLPQLWVQVQLPRHARGGLLSFCNLAPAFKRRHIACIHDLHTRIVPESYGRLFRLAHRLVLPMLGRNACRIATVSELSREHLIGQGVAPAGKIVVTYNGSDHALRWNAGVSRLQLGGSRPFALCLGRSQRYKNTELMWRLAPALDAMGLDIVIAGDIDGPTLASYGPLPGNVRLLGRISDDDFAHALSRALCLLFPSRIEGFGLPAAEAMALGCPLVASMAPCLPEVCGQAALLADPDDSEAWIAAIRRLLDEPGLRASLIARGLQRAKAFSWRRIAETYLELMAEIDGGDAVVGSAREHFPLDVDRART
jgi:glycosyltransferase involved in cell wall biosynthesis